MPALPASLLGPPGLPTSLHMHTACTLPRPPALPRLPPLLLLRMDLRNQYRNEVTPPFFQYMRTKLVRACWVFVCWVMPFPCGCASASF